MENELRKSYMYTLVWVIIAVVLALLLFVSLSQPKKRVTCDSFQPFFGSYRAAYFFANIAYKSGAPWLDRGGVPDVPCDELYIKSGHANS